MFDITLSTKSVFFLFSVGRGEGCSLAFLACVRPWLVLLFRILLLCDRTWNISS